MAAMAVAAPSGIPRVVFVRTVLREFIFVEKTLPGARALSGPEGRRAGADVLAALRGSSGPEALAARTWRSREARQPAGAVGDAPPGPGGSWAAVAGAHCPVRETPPAWLPPLHPPGWWQWAAARQPGVRRSFPAGAPAPRRARGPVGRRPPVTTAPAVVVSNGFHALEAEDDNDEVYSEHLVAREGKTDAGQAAADGEGADCGRARGEAVAAAPGGSSQDGHEPGGLPARTRAPVAGKAANVSAKGEADSADPVFDSQEGRGLGSDPNDFDVNQVSFPGFTALQGFDEAAASETAARAPRPGRKRQGKAPEDDETVLSEFRARAEAERAEVLSRAVGLAHLHARITGRTHPLPRWEEAGFTCQICEETDRSVSYPRVDGGSWCQVCTAADVAIRLRDAS